VSDAVATESTSAPAGDWITGKVLATAALLFTLMGGGVMLSGFVLGPTQARVDKLEAQQQQAQRDYIQILERLKGVEDGTADHTRILHRIEGKLDRGR